MDSHIIHPTIAELKLPNDPVRQAQLRKKLQEYLFRLKLPLYDHSVTTLKVTVLQRLLSAGSINPVSLAAELAADPTMRFDHALFYEAFTVIGCYCRDGGTRTIGGTGLPAAT